MGEALEVLLGKGGGKVGGVGLVVIKRGAMGGVVSSLSTRSLIFVTF